MNQYQPVYWNDLDLKPRLKVQPWKIALRIVKWLVLLFMLVNFFWGLGILFFRTQIATASILEDNGTKNYLSGTYFEILAGYQPDLTFKRYVFHVKDNVLYQYHYFGANSFQLVWEYSNSLFHLCFVYPISWLLVQTSYGFGWTSQNLASTQNLWIMISAIFVVSLLVRLFISYNSWKTYKNKDKMELAQQKVATIKEKYRDQTDFQGKQRQQLEIMQVYKKANLSPGSSSLEAFMFTPFLFAIFVVVRTTRMIKDSGTATFSLTQTIWDSLTTYQWIFLIPVAVYLVLFVLDNFVLDRFLKTPKPVVVIKNPKKTNKSRSFLFKWAFKIMFLVFFFIVPTGTSIYWIFSSFFEVCQKIIFFYLARWHKKRDLLIRKGLVEPWHKKFAFFKKAGS